MTHDHEALVIKAIDARISALHQFMRTRSRHDFDAWVALHVEHDVLGIHNAPLKDHRGAIESRRKEIEHD